MHREMITRLIERCKSASDEMRSHALAAEIERLIKDSSPQVFLDWIKEDGEYSYYYYDAQQSGVCAKPSEAMALILESIALDALE